MDNFIGFFIAFDIVLGTMNTIDITFCLVKGIVNFVYVPNPSHFHFFYFIKRNNTIGLLFNL